MQGGSDGLMETLYLHGVHSGLKHREGEGEKAQSVGGRQHPPWHSAPHSLGVLLENRVLKGRAPQLCAGPHAGSGSWLLAGQELSWEAQRRGLGQGAKQLKEILERLGDG